MYYDFSLIIVHDNLRKLKGVANPHTHVLFIVTHTDFK